MSIYLADLGISELMPPDLRRQLLDVENWPRYSAWPGQLSRVERIDQINDEAVRRGLARPRCDTSLLDSMAKEATA